MSITYLAETQSGSMMSHHRLRGRAEQAARRMHRDTGEPVYLCEVRDGLTVRRPVRPWIGGGAA